MASYGRQTVNVSIAATKGTDPDAGATAGYFTFVDSASETFAAPKVFVQNHPDSGVNLYGVWNEPSTASLTVATNKWDFVLSPGDYITSPDGIWVKNETNYTIRGWN
jgi:hypothetical protein